VRRLANGEVTPDAATRAAVRVGVLTVAIGAALTAAPNRAGPVVGLADPRAARLVGLADLALVPGLLRGRPRWPWLAARIGLNVTIIGYAVGTARGNRRSRICAAALMAATVSDLSPLVALWGSERPHSPSAVCRRITD
jgi:hypothetical protein